MLKLKLQYFAATNLGPSAGANPRGPPGWGGRPELALPPWERAGVGGREIKRANCGRPWGRRSEKGQGRQQPTQNRLPPGACPPEGSRGPEGDRDRFRCPLLPVETWKPGLEAGRKAEIPPPSAPILDSGPPGHAPTHPVARAPPSPSRAALETPHPPASQPDHATRRGGSRLRAGSSGPRDSQEWVCVLLRECVSPRRLRPRE